MPNKIINIGVVGVGKLGTYHIQKLLNKENCNFIGIYDTDLDIIVWFVIQSGSGLHPQWQIFFKK